MRKQIPRLPEGYHHLRALVVDDMAQTRFLIRNMLRYLGIDQVSEADSVQDAFRMIKLVRPDVVFTDWEMPSGSGLDLVRRIRTHPESPDPTMAVIMVTAHGSAELVLAGRAAGATDFLVKPISPARLVERLVDAVTRQRSFIVTASYRGPDRRRSDRPHPVNRRSSTRLAKGVTVLPPDNLLQARVSGDPDAVAAALKRKEQSAARLASALSGEPPVEIVLHDLIEDALASVQGTAAALETMTLPLQRLRQGGLGAMPPFAERVVTSMQRLIAESDAVSLDVGLMRLHMMTLRAMLRAGADPASLQIAEELALRIEEMTNARR